MSLLERTIHVIGKDLRRFWPFLGGLFALTGAYVVVDSIGASGYLGQLPARVVPALLAILAVTVVHEDAPSGKAFWVTRPLGPTAVLVAKLAFIGLFLWAIPVTAHVTWLAAEGGRGITTGMVVDAALFHGSVLAIVVAAAAVTPDIGRFLLVVALGWAGMGVVTGVAAWTGAELGSGAYETRAYLMRVVWLGVGLALFVHQYRSRHTARTVALGVVALGVLVAAVQRSEVDWTVGEISDEDRVEYPDPTAIGLRLASLRVGDRGDRTGAAATVTVSPSPLPSVLLDPIRVRTRILGTALDRRFDIDLLHGPFRTQPGGITALDDARPVDGGRPVARRARPIFFDIVRGLQADAVQDLHERADRIEVDVTFDVLRSRPLGTLALTPGTALATDQGIYAVLGATVAPGVVTAEVRGRWPERALSTAGRAFAERSAIVLYNPEHGTYVEAQGRGGGSGAIPGLVGGSRLSEWRWDLTFELATLPELPTDWLEGAVLRVLGLRYEGTFARSLVRDIAEWPVSGGSVTIDGDWPLRARAGG